MTFRTENCKISSPQEQASNVVGHYDILCGRGKDAYNNDGNKRFREIVASWVPRYLGAPRRLERSLTVDALAEAIKADGGRFLKEQKQPGALVLVELTSKQIRTKVGHSLRDVAALKAKKSSLKAKKSSCKGDGSNVKSQSKNTTTRKMSVISKDASALTQQQHQRQPPRNQERKFELDPHHGCESQSIGTFTGEDVLEATAWENILMTEEGCACSEVVSVVTLESFDNNDEQDWFKAPSPTLEGPSSSSSFGDDDNAVDHILRPDASDQLLLQQTFTELGDFLETKIFAAASEDPPPVAEIIF